MHVTPISAASRHEGPGDGGAGADQATSTPRRASRDSSRTTWSSPANSTCVPAEREDASGTNSSTGNRRSCEDAGHLPADGTGGSDDRDLHRSQPYRTLRRSAGPSGTATTGASARDRPAWSSTPSRSANWSLLGCRALPHPDGGRGRGFALDPRARPHHAVLHCRRPPGGSASRRSRDCGGPTTCARPSCPPVTSSSWRMPSTTTATSPCRRTSSRRAHRRRPCATSRCARPSPRMPTWCAGSRATSSTTSSTTSPNGDGSSRCGAMSRWVRHPRHERAVRRGGKHRHVHARASSTHRRADRDALAAASRMCGARAPRGRRMLVLQPSLETDPGACRDGRLDAVAARGVLGPGRARALGVQAEALVDDLDGARSRRPCGSRRRCGSARWRSSRC